MTRHEREPRRAEYIYDGQVLIAVVEPLDDGRWRLIVRKREIGIFDTREAAFAALDDGGAS